MEKTKSCERKKLKIAKKYKLRNGVRWGGEREKENLPNMLNIFIASAALLNIRGRICIADFIECKKQQKLATKMLAKVPKNKGGESHIRKLGRFNAGYGSIFLQTTFPTHFSFLTPFALYAFFSSNYYFLIPTPRLMLSSVVQ